MSSLRSGRPFSAAAWVGLLATVTLASSARADDASARKELEAIYAQYNRLIQQDERYELRRFFLGHTTDDYHMKSTQGWTVSREDAAANLKTGQMAAGRYTGHEYQILKLTVKGSQGVVLYKERTTAMLDDPQGNAHELVTSGTARDTWVRTPEGWKTRLSEVFTSKTLLDGREIRARPARSRRSARRR
jgi:SnoaL-like domain